jgi:hypothetical protein
LILLKLFLKPELYPVMFTTNSLFSISNTGYIAQTSSLAIKTHLLTRFSGFALALQLWNVGIQKTKGRETQMNLNERISEIQILKRMQKYSEALPLALDLVANNPTEPLAYKSLAKVQALVGDMGSAKESMAMVLNLFQTDLTTAFTDVQYQQRITPLFQHLFLEYINAAYYVTEFGKYENGTLPESTQTALLGESMPKVGSDRNLKQQILSGVKQCNPLWERNQNDFKKLVENLIDSISLK